MTHGRYHEQKTQQFSINTTIERADGTTDVLVTFTATMTSAGAPATRVDPPEGPEWDLTFVSAELDVPAGLRPPTDTPLTETEIATIKKWFETNEEAYKHVAENWDWQPGYDG